MPQRTCKAASQPASHLYLDCVGSNFPLLSQQTLIHSSLCPIQERPSGVTQSPKHRRPKRLRNFPRPLKSCLAPEAPLLCPKLGTHTGYAGHHVSLPLSALSHCPPVTPSPTILFSFPEPCSSPSERLHTPYRLGCMIHSVHLLARLLSRPQKVPWAGGDHICFAPHQIPSAKHSTQDQEKLTRLVTDNHCSVSPFNRAFFKFSTFNPK